MQNAKDTFYAALRDRLTAQFPAKTAVVQGTTRAAVVVEENELALPELPLNTFVLRWVECKTDELLETMRCEIRYATEGSGEFAGLDRGRALTTMDAVLRALLEPRLCVKKSYTGAAPVTMLTNVWWSAAAFGEATVKDGRLERVAMVDVMSQREAGE